MEKYIDASKIILLFDKYTWESQLLYESVRKTTDNCLAIVLEDEEEFLPNDVLSVYDLFLEDDICRAEHTGKPKYYNEITIPDYWSIMATVEGDYGKISYQHEEKGRIHYLKSKKYVVKAVEWYDRKGVTRFWDHYDRYGNICARTVCDHEGQQISKTWFTAKGQEVFVENLKTGDVILNYGEFVKLFRTKHDMIIWYLNKQFAKNRIFFNSLATPFLFSNALYSSRKEDVLFWQEPVGNEIPGNMKMILDGRAGRTNKIVVQKRHAYSKLLELGVNKDAISELGFIYPFEKDNQHKREALICTNSDKIEHCRELIETFPQMNFYIAAVTAMSSKLLELQRYENVYLYPGVVPNVLAELFQKCDIYFDINYYSELDYAVRKAFLHNQLIFAFEETLHNAQYVAEEHIYPVAAFEAMVFDVGEVLKDEAVFDQHMERQHRYALAENVETYGRMCEC